MTDFTKVIEDLKEEIAWIKARGISVDGYYINDAGCAKYQGRLKAFIEVLEKLEPSRKIDKTKFEFDNLPRFSGGFLNSQNTIYEFRINGLMSEIAFDSSKKQLRTIIEALTQAYNHMVEE